MKKILESVLTWIVCGLCFLLTLAMAKGFLGFTWKMLLSAIPGVPFVLGPLYVIGLVVGVLAALYPLALLIGVFTGETKKEDWKLGWIWVGLLTYGGICWAILLVGVKLSD